MTDLKFSCPQCGQHISCGESWSGHQIECPVCHGKLVVPQVPPPAAPPVAAAPVKETSKPAGARLAAGVTQVPRSTAPPTPAAPRRSLPRPPRSQNSLLKYGILLVVVAVLGALGYFYGLPLLTNALQQEPGGKAPASAKSSQAGGAVGGPMGEVGGAMDVSETLDGGSAPRTPPPPATTNAARPRPAAPRK